MREINIACCQYQIEHLPDWKSYTEKIELLITQAKQKSADLILLPEYAGIEVVCGKYKTDLALYQALQPLIPNYINFYKNLAQQYQIYIQPGTIIEQIAQNQYVNRAYFFTPEGKYGFQDKLQLTEFEKSLKVLQRGKQQYLFKTLLGNIGIAICYDSEFPEIVRKLTQSGASLILVPSYTTSLAGYHRVFLSCRARAIENQCYVAMASIVNVVELSGVIDHTYGKAAILSPADNGFPDDGIISEGTINKTLTIFGKIADEKITAVRRKGEVHNFADSKHCEFLVNEKIKIFTHCP